MVKLTALECFRNFRAMVTYSFALIRMNSIMLNHRTKLPEAKFFTAIMLSRAALVAMLIAAPLTTIAGGWGAISADDEFGERDPFHGIGGGDSKAEATKNSQKFCKEAGGKNCEVLVTYQQCGAYAVSRKFSGTGVGPTKTAAEKKALEQCSSSSCNVVVSDCND